jgi:hypothetical protein
LFTCVKIFYQKNRTAEFKFINNIILFVYLLDWLFLWLKFKFLCKSQNRFTKWKHYRWIREKKKYFYWFEALNFCGSMSNSVISMTKLEILFQIIFRSAMLFIYNICWHNLKKSKCIRINRINSKCTPIYYVSQMNNKKQFFSNVCVCILV